MPYRRRIAVVRDEFDLSQDRMHLDCVFGLLSETCCVCYEDMLGENSPKRRLVDEYTMGPQTGLYDRTREGVEFGAYLTDNKIHVITIPHEAQVRRWRVTAFAVSACDASLAHPPPFRPTCSWSTRATC